MVIFVFVLFSYISENPSFHLMILKICQVVSSSTEILSLHLYTFEYNTFWKKKIFSQIHRLWIKNVYNVDMPFLLKYQCDIKNKLV